MDLDGDGDVGEIGSGKLAGRECGVVLMAGEDCCVCALDGCTGEKLWEVPQHRVSRTFLP